MLRNGRCSAIVASGALAGGGKTTPKRKGRAKAKPALRKKTKSSAPPQRPGFGGAWRAFIRKKRLRLTADNVTRLSEEFQEAKRARTTEFLDAERAGKATTKAGRVGQRGFGSRPSQILRSRKVLHQQYEALLARLPDEDVGMQALTLARQSVATGATVRETLAAARAGQRTLTSRREADMEKCAMALEEYDEKLGAAAVEAARQVCPQLRDLTLRAEATPIGTHLVLQDPTSEDIADALTWAKGNAQGSGLVVRLDKYWQRAHRPLACAGEEIPQQTQGPFATTPASVCAAEQGLN